MGALILLTLLLEVGVLLYLEIKAWDTLYTPLNYLMLPYVAVLLFTVAVAGHWGIVDFYYPSIMYWSVGLLAFAVPSYIMGFSMHRHGKQVSAPISTTEMPRILVWLAAFMCVAFLFRLKQTLGSSGATLGSDEFGMDYDGHGLWAHLSKLNTPLLIMCIYFVDKKHRYLWVIILLLLFIAFLHQVKGWIIIPCVAGLSLRLYSGKTHLTWRFLVLLVTGAVLVFLISYILSLVVGANAELSSSVIGFILRNFVHYVTSGTLGMSMDVALDLPEHGPFQLLFAQIVNIVNLLLGETDIISPVNNLFLHSGINGTNVRTMFGTMALYTTPMQFVLATFFLSSISYLLKIMTARHRSIFSNIVYFYQCSLLAMGWFEYYFFHLDAIEVPFMTVLIYILTGMFKDKTRVDL